MQDLKSVIKVVEYESLTQAALVRHPVVPLPEGLHLFDELRRFQKLLDLRAVLPFSRPIRAVRQTPDERRRDGRVGLCFTLVHLTYPSDPHMPCSSPVKRTKRIVRRGFSPNCLTPRATSIKGVAWE